jgi:hypothetical protein
MNATTFSVHLEVKIKTPLNEYASIKNDRASTSYINEIAKNTVAEDIEDALRKYGVDATVELVRKIQQ